MMNEADSNERYRPSTIESKWQRYWDEHQTFATPACGDEPKRYILDMFPYPSGAGLHVGHPEGYTATDILARFYRAQGLAVLHPMGWDAFGLPAEQHAIQTGTHPRETTRRNIDNFRRQLKALGFSYDWSREVDTTDPAYFKWTQWIFLKLFERGLAYQEEIPVNWCPALGTVLANEEVKDGRSERGAHPVHRVPLRQWMLKITAYADRLLEGLAQVQWPEGTRVMQHEWIGRSEGAEVEFAIKDHADERLTVFTTRPDTLFGVTFVAIAPEHPLVETITADVQKDTVATYVKQARGRSDLERTQSKIKTGVSTGAYCIHPLSGAAVPIFVADYVLMGYGTGAIMAVPAHDERDFEFARKYNLPVVQVISKDGCADEVLEQADPAPGVLLNSDTFNGFSSADAQSAIIDELERKGLGRRRTQYKLRDWVFSRQRYWGEPIPIYFPVTTDGDPRQGAAHTIHFDQPIPVDERELPLMLPELDDYKPGEDPAGALARATDWRFFERDGQWYARETNTMPQWAGSCWYYLRYTDPRNPDKIFAPEAVNRWLPVDLYVGGAEHAVLHLLYARFWHMVLHDDGLVSTPEPFAKLVHQGMILGEIEYTSYRTDNGTHVSASDLTEIELDGSLVKVETQSREKVQEISVTGNDVEKKGGDFVLRGTNTRVDARAHKMSKSRGNVVNPDDVIEQFGADAMRLYEMFMGPLEATKPWNTDSIQGVARFLDKVWGLASKVEPDATPSDDMLRMTHQTIKKVTEDIEGLRFNTAISAMMTMVNELSKQTHVDRSSVEILVKLVHPFAPHLAEELWERLGHAPSVQHAEWPAHDASLMVEKELEIPVQINGKKRGVVRVSPGASEREVFVRASADASLSKYWEGKTFARKIWVQDRILNLIVKG